MRRAVVSIPSNIAEWNERNTNKEYANFLYIAKGSAAELETQVIIAKELKFITEEVKDGLSSQIGEILKMLSALIKSVYKRDER